MKKIITSVFAILLFATTNSQNISGNWTGKVQISAEKTLEFNFQITKDGENYITIIDIWLKDTDYNF